MSRIDPAFLSVYFNLERQEVKVRLDTFTREMVDCGGLHFSSSELHMDANLPSLLPLAVGTAVLDTSTGALPRGSDGILQVQQ